MKKAIEEFKFKIKKGDILPDFCLEDSQGRKFSNEEFSRKKNLVVFYLFEIKKSLADYLLALDSELEKIKQGNAELLVIFFRKYPDNLNLSKEIRCHLLIDKEGVFLGKLLYNAGPKREAFCFIADKFYSLYKVYSDGLPQIDEIVASLDFLEKQCPECGAPTWGNDNKLSV